MASTDYKVRIVKSILSPQTGTFDAQPASVDSVVPMLLNSPSEGVLTVLFDGFTLSVQASNLQGGQVTYIVRKPGHPLDDGHFITLGIVAYKVLGGCASEFRQLDTVISLSSTERYRITLNKVPT